MCMSVAGQKNTPDSWSHSLIPVPMSNTLKFAETISINAFKNAHNLSVVSMIKSPKTGKYFFTSDAGVSGKVSERVAGGETANVFVSLCNDGVNEPFFMIHTSNEDNVVFSW